MTEKWQNYEKLPKTNHRHCHGGAAGAGPDARRPIDAKGETGGVFSIEYDADGRVIKAVDAEGAETEYLYDLNGNVVKAIDALGNGTSFEYDAMGRVSSITDARDATTAYAYTATGKVASITDALGGVKAYEYDLLGRLTREENELGEATTYSYDALGRVLSAADPLGHADVFTYDATGEWTSEEVESYPLDDIIEPHDYNVDPGGGLSPLGSVEEVVKLYYHHDRLGSTDYLTSNVDGRAVSYVTYDDWGALTAKAVLKTLIQKLII